MEIFGFFVDNKDMELYIRVLSGNRVNDIFKIQPDLTLGRSKASINIKDPKASSVHGKIEKEGEFFVYVDCKSTNGTSSNGQKIDRLRLEAGTKFIIGSTEFEIVTDFMLKKNTQVNLSEWREKLFNHMKNLPAEQSETPLSPLSKLVSIKVKSGIFSGKEWILGYGPRTIGPNNPDMCLLDPGLQETLLLLKEDGGNFSLSALITKGALLNGRSTESVLMTDSVEVQINNTILELKFIDEAN